MNVHALLAVLLASACSAPVCAASFSFTGTLNQVDDVQLIPFSLLQDAAVTARTWSYAGGVNAAGDTIPEGGFDVVLSLFDAAGLLVALNDDGDSAVEPSVVTGNRYDSFLSLNLQPGDYVLTVSMFSNFPVGDSFASGFDGTGLADFGARTAFWAADLINVDAASVGALRDDLVVAAVPVPAAAVLFAPGLLGLSLVRRQA